MVVGPFSYLSVNAALFTTAWYRGVPRTTGKIVSAALFVLFFVYCDMKSTYDYPVHSSGSIVITGASSGIGRSVAKVLARDHGYDVFAGVRSAKDFESIKAEGIKGLHPLFLDVTKPEQVTAAVAEVKKFGKPLVALVNNAGIEDGLPIEISPLQHFRNVFEVNVFGVVETTRQFLGMLRDSKGRVINIGSIAGDMGQMPGWTQYTASKHALEAFSDGLRTEMMDHQVSVSLVKPGGVKTEIWDKIGDENGSSANDQIEDDYMKLMARATGSSAVKDIYKKTVLMLAELGNAASTGKLALPGPEITDEAIVHAITSAKPHTRYLVTPDSILYYYLNNLLPDRVFDSFMHWFYYGQGYKNFY
jgi:NAD(P)-dependent dehydrogenase (short-subunit alcohol dehydrogenase family)